MSVTFEPVLVPDPSYKPAITIPDVIIGCLTGGLFTTLALFDVSVLSFGYDAFTAQYFIFKSQAPYIKGFLGIITLLLPLVLVTKTVGFYRIFTAKASAIRNFADAFDFLSLLFIIYDVIALSGPMQEQLVDLALSEKFSQIAPLIEGLWAKCLIILGINIAAIVIQLMAFADSHKNPIPLVLPPPSKTDDKTTKEQTKTAESTPSTTETKTSPVLTAVPTPEEKKKVD